MQFLYPTFLFALLALAIPIIVHLFHFRRFKKVYFTNVRFLREVKEETSARRKLRNLLVLLMRCLALAFLVFAFAQPFLPRNTDVKKGEKAVSIFVDNSFSMSALSQDTPLLNKAKQRARDVINAHPVENRFQILTNDFEGRHQRLMSKEDALVMVDEIKISPAVREMSKVMTRQKQALNSGTADNHAAYLISDFQKNVTDISNYADTMVDLTLIPLQSVQEKNIAIDSAWFDAPVQMINQTNALVVKIRNLSDENAENVRLTIKYEGQVKPVGTLSIPANSSISDTVNITILRTGWHEAELAVTDFPVQFDDKYFFTFKVAEEINVLTINDSQPNNFLEKAFTGMTNFKVTSQQSRNLDYSKFTDYQMIVVNELAAISSGLAFELKQFTENSGNLLIFPSANANLGSYNSFLKTFPANELVSYDVVQRFVGRINTDEFIFNDVFQNRMANLKLPVTQANFKLTNYGSRGEERLLTYRDGTPNLTKYTVGKGHLYFSASPLNGEMNNLVRSGEIFIPMLYKMAISSAKANKIAYTIGRDEVIIADNKIQGSGETVYKLQGTAEEFIPEQRIVTSNVYLDVHDKIKEAGFYELFLNPEDKLAKYAFNFDRKESVLEYFNVEDLTAKIGANATVLSTSAASITEEISERSRGVILWKWCVILALFFLGLEVLFLRFFKV
jgi:hypothetical protein